MFMAISCKDYQEDAKFRLMQRINPNPQVTSRRFAQNVGISIGSALYLLLSLIDMGFVRLSNFKENSQKVGYLSFNPKGCL